MWNVADPDAKIQGMRIPQKPLWHLPSSLDTVSADQRPMPQGVFPAIFSLESAGAFIEEFGKMPWFSEVRDIALERRAGADLFRLRMSYRGREFVVLIQREKYGGVDFGAALENVLNRLAEEGGNHLIDATYEGKIVVNSLTGGAGEGSSK